MKRFQQGLQSHSGKVAELFSALLLYRCIGFASFASLTYSPLFLAQTLRVHTDALATVFILLRVLLCLCYCASGRHRQLRGHFFMRRSVTTLPEHAAF